MGFASGYTLMHEHMSIAVAMGKGDYDALRHLKSATTRVMVAAVWSSQAGAPRHSSDRIHGNGLSFDPRLRHIAGTDEHISSNVTALALPILATRSAHPFVNPAREKSQRGVWFVAFARRAQSLSFIS